MDALNRINGHLGKLHFYIDGKLVMEMRFNEDRTEVHLIKHYPLIIYEASDYHG